MSHYHFGRARQQELLRSVHEQNRVQRPAHRIVARGGRSRLSSIRTRLHSAIRSITPTANPDRTVLSSAEESA